MKTIYLATANQLKTVADLRWVDADMGQLDIYQNPPVAFPCALIDIDLPSCEDIGGSDQECIARINVRLAFMPKGQTSTNAPEAYQTQALAFWDTVSTVFQKLQAYETSELSPFTRKSQTVERRSDDLKVIRQVWETTFIESVL